MNEENILKENYWPVLINKWNFFYYIQKNQINEKPYKHFVICVFV